MLVARTFMFCDKPRFGAITAYACTVSYSYRSCRRASQESAIRTLRSYEAGVGKRFKSSLSGRLSFLLPYFGA